MFYSVVLAFITAALVVAANPVVVPRSHVSLPFAKVISTTGTANIVEKDRARIKALKARPQSNKLQDDWVISYPINNMAVSYVASIGVGTPPSFYNLIVDTGSSNTWVGAGSPYVNTSSSVDTGNSVFVEYGSGVFGGEEYTDTVTIGSIVIGNQGVGAANFAFGFQGVDGILGIGPVDLTNETLYPDEYELIPTVVDNAFSQDLILDHSVAVSFEPTTSDSSVNGELTFGGVDESKFTGSITYTPVTSTYPASQYWGIEQTISYGGIPILSTTSGIVDTGTTLLYIPSDAYSVYQNATGATLDEYTGLLTISNEQYDLLQDLVFTIGGAQFILSPNAQIWPRSLNTVLGGNASSIYLVVIDIGAPTGSGLDFIDGQVFLERFYSVFDTANQQVGFATTPFTNAETN